MATATSEDDGKPKLTLLSLPPELLVYLASHLNTTQDYLALSATSRQLRACCLSLRPKALRLLMERTLEEALDKDKAAVEPYLASLQSCKFCERYFAEDENRKTYRRTNPTRRYNLILNHETKDVCGGCLTLALAFKYCWYPWFASSTSLELRYSYLFAIQARVADPEGYLHQTL